MNTIKENHRELAEEIFLAGIEGVKPELLLRSCIRTESNMIWFGKHSVNLDSTGSIFVVGAGKASGAMAVEVERILGSRIKGGLVVVKYGHKVKTQVVEICEAGHPLPDQNGFAASVRIREIAEKAGEGDLIICLFSGGGSALLADAPSNASPEDIIRANEILVRSGADINEINIVRKHLSDLKGGRLAKLAYPARSVCIMISDVPGDDPGVIASGPFVPDESTFGDALKVIDKYSLGSSFPGSLLTILKEGAEGKIPETPKTGEMIFENVHNIIAGNNRSALEAAARQARSLGFTVIVDDEQVNLPVEEAAVKISGIARMYKNDLDIKKPACILFGGETVLKVSGSGTGGRNQHLALACARLIRNQEGITILCAGTDGTDGPTNAAGAVIDTFTWTDAVMNRIDPESYLKDYDSFNFFREAGGHIITGPTLTNVMDMAVVLI